MEKNLNTKKYTETMKKESPERILSGGGSGGVPPQYKVPQDWGI
jgi:hypothetical protein